EAELRNLDTVVQRDVRDLAHSLLALLAKAGRIRRDNRPSAFPCWLRPRSSLRRGGTLELAHGAIAAAEADRAHPGAEPARQPLDAGVPGERARGDHLLQRCRRRDPRPALRGVGEDLIRGVDEQ